jgi:hypothetical protein
MFFTNLFSLATRRRMCERSYQNTRAMLWKRRDEIDRVLARHGMHLKRSVLQDASLSLVKSPTPSKKDRFGVAKLSESLDTLERHLKVAGA